MPRAKRHGQGSSSRRRHSLEHELPPHIKWLSDDAPLGAYLVDTVAQGLFEVKGTSVLETLSHLEVEPFIQHLASSQDSPIAFARLIRQRISFSANYSVMVARNYFVNNPRRLHLTRRFFGDLPKIRVLIDRNKSLNPLALFLSTTKLVQLSRSQSGTDQIKHLQSALQLVSKLIGEYLLSYKPQGKPGNHDPFARAFIDEIFELWCDHVWVEPLPSENRLFIRLIAAAWLDLRLPTKDHKGVRLEDWLNDRVRKRFPDGIHSSRLSRQEMTIFNRTNMSAVTNVEQ
jgi:hypothetical protein